MKKLTVLIGFSLFLFTLTACGPTANLVNGHIEPQPLPVAGPPSISGEQLAQWYYIHKVDSWCYRATVPLEELANTYIQEGVKEGVRGDVGFMQSVIETGWFCWPGGQVHPEDNNFAGLGATDNGGGRNVGHFPTARAGIRAQMQHLVAYSTTDRPCDDPCYDNRFNLVRRGTGVNWEQYGNGVWATSTNNYGGRILAMYATGLEYRDQQSAVVSSPRARRVAPVAPSVPVQPETTG